MQRGVAMFVDLLQFCIVLHCSFVAFQIAINTGWMQSCSALLWYEVYVVPRINKTFNEQSSEHAGEFTINAVNSQLTGNKNISTDSAEM